MVDTKVLDDWEDRDEFENEDATEGEDDVVVTAAQFEELVIAPSDWTVSTIYNLIGKQLELDPAYQRRNVWAQRSKSKFIESLMLGIPIPQILLASRAGQKNAFLVLDGKQRLTAIKEFIDGKYADGKRFKLRGLRMLKELEGKTWAEIKDDPDWANRLENEPIRTTVLRGWGSEGVLYEIFYRLNSGSVRLSPMELRMSLHPGEFLKFIISWTEKIGPVHRLLRKRQPDPRMGDVELAIRFLAFRRGDLVYEGDLKRFLDRCCEVLNGQFADDALKAATEAELGSMTDAIEAGFEIFGDNRFCRKFSEKAYERRFNRAVFDVQVGALAEPNVRSWSLANRQQVVELFEELSSSTPAFVRAVETTTKSVESTRARFGLWYGCIEKASGIKLALPNIK